MWELGMVVVLIGALALLIGPRLIKRGPRADEAAQGTLLVTGVSPRPENVTGEQYVTITGVISGPTVNEHVVYQQMAVDVDDWPRMGAQLPVVYSPKNPDKWNFAPPDPLPPPA